MSAIAEDFDDEYDEYYDDDEGISGFVVLVVAIVILAVFSAVVWFAYQRGMQTGASRDGGVPIVAADPTPAKTERELELSSTGNQEVYDRLEGNVPSEIVVAAQTDRDPLDGFGETASASEMATQDDPVTEVNDAPPVTQPATQDEPVLVAEAATPEPQEQDEPARQVPVPVTKTSVLPEQPEPQPAAATPATTSTATGGTHVVQVGAFRSDEEATGYYNKLSNQFGAFLAGKSPDIQRADLGSRGIYYRLRIAPFNSKADAQSYCTSLKSGGQDCLVKPR